LGRKKGRKGRELTIQFAVVLIAFAGALILSGVISAGYNHVIPNHPIAKKLLNTNRKTVASSPKLALSMLLKAPARMAMEADMPAAPNIMRERRPNFSIVKMAIQDAIQYSVPLQAERRRDRKGERPMLFSKMVAA
jgi:hypothetical protein